MVKCLARSAYELSLACMSYADVSRAGDLGFDSRNRQLQKIPMVRFFEGGEENGCLITRHVPPFPLHTTTVLDIKLPIRQHFA